MKTKTLLFAIFLLANIGLAQAQHWDWVKGYGTQSSQETGFEIIGTVTDNDGNLYFMGEFRNDSDWDGEALLPSGSYLGGDVSVIIAKISPKGDMVWKKIVHSKVGVHAYDIKKIGDTSFACMINFAIPNVIYSLFWLDTLLPGGSEYLIPSELPSMPMTRFYGFDATAFVKFNFDGTVLEQHFLTKTYLDMHGEDIGYRYSNNVDTLWLDGGGFQRPAFDVDNQGNIYVVRTPTDMAGHPTGESWTVENGTIRGVKVWVDGRVAGVIDASRQTDLWRPHLMKFAPHFDTLLADRYIVQDIVNEHHPQDPYRRLRVDRDANIYFSMRKQFDFDSDYIQTIVFDSLQGMTADVDWYTGSKGFLLVYDSALNATRMIHLQDMTLGESDGTYITNVSFDYDSNLVFVQGEYGVVYECVYNKSYPVELKGSAKDTTLYMYNDCFVLKFDRNTWEFKGSIKPPVCMCDIGGYIIDYPNIVTKNNRVFMQIQHIGKITLPTGTFQGPSDFMKTSSLVIFDYAGNVVGGDHSRQFSQSGFRRNGPLALVDSVLYVVQITNFPATFGDFTVTPTGKKYSYVAKYVDPSFMTVQPYTPPTPSEAVQTTVESGTLTLYPNPASSTVTLRASDSWQEATVSIVDIEGRERGRYQLQAGSGQLTIDVGGFAKGVYFVSITSDQAAAVRKLVVQ